jgi:hypothetical protein
MGATDWIILIAIIGLIFLGILVLFKEQIIELLKKKCCHHEWEKYHIHQTYADESDKLPMYVTHTLICKKCGKIKQFKAGL